MMTRIRISIVLLIGFALVAAPARVLADPTAEIFVNVGAALTPVSDSAVAWGDFDNDGDPDPVITGDTGNSRITTLYQNNPDRKFTAVSANLIGVSHGAAAW
jgi:hypothetical protein